MLGLKLTHVSKRGPLSPGQNGRYFTDHMLNWISFSEIFCEVVETSLMIIPDDEEWQWVNTDLSDNLPSNGYNYLNEYSPILLGCYATLGLDVWTHLGLTLFSGSPPGAIREIEGFATHICVTREMGAVFRDVYMRHQAKILTQWFRENLVESKNEP